MNGLDVDQFELRQRDQALEDLEEEQAVVLFCVKAQTRLHSQDKLLEILRKSDKT
jgi:hypothetical protein